MQIYNELSLIESLSIIRNTAFYKKHIDKLYICDEDSYRIVFETNTEYSYEEERYFIDTVENKIPYSLFNIEYMDYKDHGQPSLTLREV